MSGNNTIRETYSIASHVEKVTDKFIAGVELEIEDIRSLGINMDNIGWSVTEDGSLRNNGRELISGPFSYDKLVSDFKTIHGAMKHSSPSQAFSDRTSIHVHVNCLDLNQEQVKSIVLWYALFEPVFFAMCSPHRANNIHCVPLDQTVLCENYRRNIPIMVQKWSKYTALNLLPLGKYGTIEFRHMEGHDDSAKFAWWLKTLENLWAYGKSHILNKGFLAKDKPVLEAFDAIFKDAPIKSIRGSVEELVSDTLIDIKLSLFS